MSDENKDENKKVRELVEKTRFCMLTSTTPEGTLESRPMTPQEVGDDFTILFITQRGNDVAVESDGKQVNLAFADGNDFVSLSGKGSIRDDVAKKKELWNPFNDAYCEGGPENPDNVILAIECDSARYWDSPSAPVSLLSVLKATVTGGKPQAGESGSVEL